MRDIKFRAWDKRARQMYQVKNLGVGKEGWTRTAENYDEQPETGYNKFYPSEVEVMQYTGLKDKKGKEIYEGDIVKVFSDKRWITGKIIYEHSEFLVDVMNNKDLNFGRVGIIEKFIEVIGNIYDNPDLLEKASD